MRMVPNSARPPASHRCAGIDGCKSGWVIASRTGLRVASNLEIHDLDYDIVGIDMPMGIPDSPGREADTSARAFLGPRRSSIFDVPARPLLEAATYADANEQSRRLFSRGLSKQSWHLVTKIIEVDRLARQTDRLVEVHPECSFRTMADVDLASKKSPEGIAQRRSLIDTHLGISVPTLHGATIDDVLDAYAALWSAERFASGRHTTFGDSALDRNGVPMRIVT